MTRQTTLSFLFAVGFLGFGPIAGADSAISPSMGPISIHGTVLSEAGGPLAGARIDLVPVLTGFELLRGQLELRPDVEPVTTTHSHGDGRFTVEAPAAGMWRLFVHAPGHLGLRAFSVPLTHDIELDPARMPRDAGARLRVVDTEGRPVAGAGVWIGSGSRNLWQSVAAGVWRAAPRIGWTDREGRLTIPRLAGEALKLEIWSPAGDAVTQARMIDAATVTLPLPGPHRMVEARGASGTPVPGVLVTAGARTWPLGLTDDDGRLPVPVTGDETMTVLFHPNGGHQVVRLSAAGPDPAVLTFPRAIPITGRVVDVGGKAIGDVLVWAAHDAAGFAFTDADGTFLLRPPPRAEIRVEARAPGLLPATGAATGESLLSLVLEPAASVQGRVVDADGLPLPGVQIAVRHLDTGMGSDKIEGWTSTDGAGDFRLAGLTPGTIYRLSAERDGAAAEVEAEATVSSSAREGLHLVLRSGRAAFGFARDFDERPLAGVEVRLWPAGVRAHPADQTKPADETPVTSERESTEDDPFIAVTNAEGRFETRDVPAQQLDVEAQGRGLAPLTVRGLELPPGRGPVDLGILYLEPGARVDGRVLDTRGNPLAEARIWSAPSSDRPLALAFDRATQPAATSDAMGRFVVEDLAPGKAIDLRVDHDGYLPLTLSGIEAPSAKPVTVELKLAATLAGRVVDSDGLGIERATVSARVEEPAGGDLLIGGIPAVVTDDAGRFELVDVAPGQLGVDVLADGFQPSAEQRFELAAGQKLDQALFVLERGAVLEGWVSDVRGDAVAGARVFAGRHSFTTAGDGAYRLAGIPSGSCRVEVRHEAYNRLERTVEIEPGSQRADFELVGGHAVVGLVTDDAGLAVEGAVLELEGYLEPSLEPRIYAEESAVDGTFRWDGVANGRYHLVARKAGYITTQLDTEIEIDGVGAEDLEVHLGVGATISGRVLGLSFEELADVRVQAQHGGQQLAGTVDYEGRYRVVDAGPGDWLVIASLPGGGRQAQSRVVLEDGVGDVERDLEFGAGITLSGSVVYGDADLPGATVTLTGADVAVERGVRTDLEGHFLVADLPRGSYRVGVTKPSLRLVHNQDITLDTDRDMVIEIATARIVGEVRGAVSGEPLTDALVMLKQVLGSDGSQGSLFTVASDAEGRFSLERLTSGRYSLSVQHDGHRPLMQDLDVPSSGAVDLPLTLEPTPGLEVMARLASGRAPRLLTLVAMDGGGQTALRVSRVLDPEGFVRFASFPEGTWELLVSAPDSALLRTSVSVPGEPLAAVLRDAGPLYVRVPDLVESDAIATLSVVGADQRPFQRLDTSGELERSWQVVGGWATVGGLPAGAWMLRAQAADGRAWSGSVVTTGGPGVEIELVQ